MASSTEICNLALSHLGGKEIANLEEKSEEARACKRFYETVRKEVLRDFPWPFATKVATLNLIEEEPTSEWAYSYRYPTDCLYFRKILSGFRNDNRQSRVSYRIAQDQSGKLIYTDTEEAEGEYTVNANDPILYPPDFTMAFSFLLAYYIAPRVTGGDPFKLKDSAMDAYDQKIRKARANARNEEQSEEDPESELIRARD